MRSQPSPTRSRSREQRAGTVAQNLGQRIGKTSWMGEPENVSVGHGVSLLQWRSGGVEHPHDTPPYPFMPSPTFAHSSISKLDAVSSVLCHDPHFEGRSACRKAVPVHRQPMSLGKVEEHSRIATCGNDPPGRGIRLEPVLFKILVPRHTLHSILSI